MLGTRDRKARAGLLCSSLNPLCTYLFVLESVGGATSGAHNANRTFTDSPKDVSIFLIGLIRFVARELSVYNWIGCDSNSIPPFDPGGADTVMSSLLYIV